MKILKSILSVVLLLLTTFCGCSMQYGNLTSQTSQTIQKIGCDDRSAQVYTFFDGEKIDFEYDRVSYIEVEGGEDANSGNVLDRLKYEAWMKCADGIICIKKQYKDRETGYFLDALDNKIPRTYVSTVFSGIAVKVHRTEDFNKKYGCAPDTLFASAVRSEFAQKQQSQSCSFGHVLFASVIAIVYICYKKNNP